MVKYSNISASISCLVLLDFSKITLLIVDFILRSKDLVKTIKPVSEGNDTLLDNLRGLLIPFGPTALLSLVLVRSVRFAYR